MTNEAATHARRLSDVAPVRDRGFDHATQGVFAAAAGDVQSLLERVEVRPDDDCSARFPEEHACRITLVTGDGREVSKEKSSYEGFHAEPMSWSSVEAKFRRLAAPAAGDDLQDRIVALCQKLERADVSDLTDLLARVDLPGG